MKSLILGLAESRARSPVPNLVAARGCRRGLSVRRPRERHDESVVGSRRRPAPSGTTSPFSPLPGLGGCVSLFPSKTVS